MLRREEKKEGRRQDEVKQKREKGRKNKLYIGLGILILAVAAYGISSFPTTGNMVNSLDTSGIPTTPVHWHADISLSTCGNSRSIPTAVGGRLIGNSALHTHTDGRIHSEGSILANPAEHTLGLFLDLMNIEFSEDSLLEFNNGDSCPGGEGRVKVTLNGREISDPRNYIPRDGDRIVVSFEPLQPGEVLQEVKEFSLTAKQWEFIPSQITVNKGDRVRLTITSVDVPHGFALSEYGINQVLNPGQPVTVEFVADKEGTFNTFCSVSCGIGHSGMRGSLIVK